MDDVLDTAYCNLCTPPRRLQLDVLLEHMRVVHSQHIEIEVWPDGEPVIVDLTLEPEDFASG